MAVAITTGPTSYVGPDQGIDSDLFGFRYLGFRSLDRFEAQTAESPAGLIGWPGGYLVEDRDDIFGLEYAETGLANPDSSFPSVATIMAYAITHDQGLALTLPTMHWYNDIDGMRVQVRTFMTKLLSGEFGPVPANFVIEIGSEYYAHAPHLNFTPEEMAPLYADIASAMIEEIRAVQNELALNEPRVDVQIGVQAGRDPAASSLIADNMSDAALAEIDLVIMARMPLNFGGVDRAMPNYEDSLVVFNKAIVDAGGTPAEIYMTSFNVASPTREEALRAYETTLGPEGADQVPTAGELAARSDADFEQFWQDRIERFDLGLDQPKMLMELFAEYHELGMISGVAFGTDQAYPGRLSFVDVEGKSVSLLGMDFLNFLYESVDETRMLDVSVTNTASTPNPVYAFEGEEHTTIFVMGGRTPGEVELEIEGLATDYTRAYVDVLTPDVPEDWMTRYGIPDTPGVDETPEGETFADSVAGTQAPSFRGGSMVVQVEEPGQIIRIVLAHSAEGEAQVEEWVVDPKQSVDLLAVFPDDSDPSDPGPTDPEPEPEPEPRPEDPPPVEEEEEPASAGDDGGLGMLLLMFLPLLALAGLG